MEMRRLAFALASFLLIVSVAEGTQLQRTRRYKALFVFGDSYADTGNRDKTDSALNLIGEANRAPWRKPYGSTWPGTPSGRFSDGRVFTDFYASHLGVKRPIPHRLLNSSTGKSGTASGINFAYGGSGVLFTLDPTYPNLTAQIRQLKSLIDRGVVSKRLVASSACLLVIAGNDYTGFLATNPVDQVGEFIPELMNGISHIVESLIRIFKAVAVSNLEPLGCLPSATSSNNHTACVAASNNALSVPHNQQLAAKLKRLREKHTNRTITQLDLYSAFIAAKDDLSLRPCCRGVNGSLCGDVDRNGAPLYTVCSSPESALFWDQAHPTNSGWKKIANLLFKQD